MSCTILDNNPLTKEAREVPQSADEASTDEHDDEDP